MTPKRFDTQSFHQQLAAPLATLWQLWCAPGARALWAVPGVPAEIGWLDRRPMSQTLHHECLGPSGAVQSAALVSADLVALGDADSQISVTVQRATPGALAGNDPHGFGPGLANLAELAGRSMVIQRHIRAPVEALWAAWLNPATLPQWWGPEGFSCRTRRIDLRAGGDWVFDMIGPDGTVFPNHHRYGQIAPQRRLDYSLHWGENGPKHADAWVDFAPVAAGCDITLGMAMASRAEWQEAKGFGAEALGLQTLGKLAAFVGAQ